jgi:hypothetical protein
MAKSKAQDVEVAPKAKPTKNTKTQKAPKATTPKKVSKATKGGSKTAKKTTKTAKTVKAKGTNKRYFKMIDNEGKTIGRYTGETPKQAGSKAYTKLVQRTKKAGGKVPKKVNLFLRESTRRSNRKTYGYVASRRELDVPQELEIKDNVTGETKKITYYYRNEIKKIPVPDEMQGVTKKTKKVTKKTGAKGKKASGSKTAKKASGSKTAKKTTKKASPVKAKKAGGSKSAKKAAPKKKAKTAKATKSA